MWRWQVAVLERRGYHSYPFVSDRDIDADELIRMSSELPLDATIGIHPTAAEEFVTLRSPARRAGDMQDEEGREEV